MFLILVTFLLPFPETYFAWNMMKTQFDTFFLTFTLMWWIILNVLCIKFTLVMNCLAMSLAGQNGWLFTMSYCHEGWYFKTFCYFFHVCFVYLQYINFGHRQHANTTHNAYNEWSDAEWLDQLFLFFGNDEPEQGNNNTKNVI